MSLRTTLLQFLFYDWPTFSVKVFKTLLYQRLLQWFNHWQLGIYQEISKLDIFAIALISHCWYYARYLKWKLTCYNLTDYDFSDVIFLIFLLNLKFFGMSSRFVNLLMNIYFRSSLKSISTANLYLARPYTKFLSKLYNDKFTFPWRHSKLPLLE